MINVTVDNAPELIRESELKILGFKNNVADAKAKMTTITRIIAGDVAAETVEGGAKAFKNATERETETEKRLIDNIDYQVAKNAMVSAENQKAEEEITLQYIRDTYSSERYKMRLACSTRAETSADKFLTGMQILAGLAPMLESLVSIKGTSFNTTTDQVPEDCPF